jgi:hypothetical protein
MEYAAAAVDMKKFLVALPARLRDSRTVLSIEAAAQLQALIASAAELEWRLPPSSLAALAELAALTTVKRDSITLLRLARTARPPVDEAEWSSWSSGKTDVAMSDPLAPVPVRFLQI